MSPSFSTRFFDGMPCTISLFTDVQMLPGNPYSPLNAGIAPSWLRMNCSAISSSSPVEMPGRTAPRSVSIVAWRILPPIAIRSISRADFS